MCMMCTSKILVMIYIKLADLASFTWEIKGYWKGVPNIVVENGNYGN